MKRELQAILRERRLPFDEVEPLELSQKNLRDLIALPEIERRGRVILIVGRVGAGKTTFIHRFFAQLEADDGYARFILDLRTDARAAIDPGPDELVRISKLILEQVAERYHKKHGFGSEYDPYDAATLRTIFGALVGSIERGPKKGIYARDRAALEADIANALTTAAADPTEVLPRYMRHISRRMRKPFCLVFDNVDRASEAYQRLIYSFAHELARHMEGVIILALRDATFERARRHGFLDTTNSDVVFHLHPPNLKQVVSRRIRYINKEAEAPKYTSRELRCYLGAINERAEPHQGSLARV